MKKRDQHVVPHQNGWAIKREKSERVTQIFDIQSEAVKRARELAIKQKVDLHIHRADGTIRSSDSFGNDPFPPKG